MNISLFNRYKGDRRADRRNNLVMFHTRFEHVR